MITIILLNDHHQQPKTLQAGVFSEDAKNNSGNVKNLDAQYVTWEDGPTTENLQLLKGFGKGAIQ